MSTPGQGTETDHLTESIFAGKNIVRSDALFIIGTYKRGEIVGRVAANGKYTTFVPAGAGGEEVIKAVCMKDKVLAADGFLPIAKGEFQKVGVQAVMTGLTAPITLTDKMLGEADDANIILN